MTLVVLCAAAVSVLFYKLRLPVVLGYLLAGVIVGPYTPLLPSLKDMGSIEQLSQLGVIFLMFFVGLDFDLERLRRVFWPAFIAAFFQTMLVIIIGILCAPLVGYTPLEGIFLGALLTNSASVLCIKILRDKGRIKHADSHMAIGILVFEDMVAIILLVVLGEIGPADSLQITAVYRICFLIGVFAVGVYFFGRVLAPWISRQLKGSNSGEIITLVSVALALGLSELAQFANFSIALGSFLAGTVMAQTQIVGDIQRITDPFRNLFCAIFFVTIGMLVDPVWLASNWLAVVFIAVLVVVGKTVTCWLGLFVGGQSAETGFRASISKASVGEFGFIIAAVGAASGATGPSLPSMAVGLALVTYMIVPVLNADPGRLFGWISEKTPDQVKVAGRIYEKMLDAVARRVGRITLLRLARRPLIQIVGNFLLLNGLLIIAYMGAKYFERVPPLAGYTAWVNTGVWLLAALVSLPFLSSIIRNLDVLIQLVTSTVFVSSRHPQLLSGRMTNLVHTVMLSVVIVLFGGIFLSAASSFFPSGVTLAMFIVVGCVALIMFWKSIININSRMEYLFLQSFQEQTAENEEQLRQATLRELSHVHRWHIEVETVTIAEDSIACGMLLREMHLRKKTGASIVAISRGGTTHYDPSPEVPIFAGDNLVLIGSQEQLDNARRTLATKMPGKRAEEKPFRIERVFVRADAFLAGQTLAGCDVRHRYRISVLGIQRGKKRIAPPPPDEIIHVGDILLIVGNDESIQIFKDAIETDTEILPAEPPPEGDELEAAGEAVREETAASEECGDAPAPDPEEDGPDKPRG
ncbi:cation:proton antiporter [Ruficoccus amylovorans]|uniref:Cation:proton antiporter n=1 Tax=Ruficoccus amylovorans TaxID=1804625 RepID=A0A842HBI0_9BACT|nr:cation:proton antiporter [Ruficoccus amylovorans]MBC2593630.1 cation:proton antiporter [Ruficoccus amylovorans]